MLTLSDDTIEKSASELRRRLGMETIDAPSMYNVLELLPHISRGFLFKSVTIDEMGSDEAFMDDETRTMSIRDDILEQLKSERVRARFTIAHELGHYLLGHSGQRRRNPDKTTYLTYQIRDQEREADLFASYFLVPDRLSAQAGSSEDVSRIFKVSAEAARIAFERIERRRRVANGERRRPPEKVIDFLREAQRAGYVLRSDISGFDI